MIERIIDMVLDHPKIVALIERLERIEAMLRDRA
jgi:hypothetical protein